MLTLIKQKLAGWLDGESGKKAISEQDDNTPVEIVWVKKREFVVDGQLFFIELHTFPSLTDFEKRLINAKKNGAKKCYLFSIQTLKYKNETQELIVNCAIG